MSYVQSMLQNINADHDAPVVEVEFVRSGDLHTVGMASTADADVLHVMAHGSDEPAEGPVFSSTDGRTWFSLEQLGQNVVALGRGIAAPVVIADGCGTATARWRRGFEHLIQGPVTYIGTTTDVGWHEITVFGAMFYGGLFRPDRSADPAKAALAAAEKAAAAYTALLGKRCPYRAVNLHPSAGALERLQPTGT